MRNLVTLSLIVLSMYMFGQEQPKLNRVVAKMWTVDSMNNSDTVAFGYDKDATSNIDTQLGEKNIIDQAYNSTLEIRSVQRKSENQTCSQNGYAFYSDSDFDTKVNFRNILTAGNFFEFIVKGKNYPIQLYADFKELFDSTYYNASSRVDLVDSLCNTTKTINPYRAEKLLLTIDNSKEYLVKVKLDYIFDGLSTIRKNKDYNVFPTCVSDYLNITNTSDAQSNLVEIYNSVGQKVLMQSFSKSLKLDLNFMKQGMYVVQLKCPEKAIIETYKITKK